MQMTAVVLAAPDTCGAQGPDPLLIAALVRAVALPQDYLEHVAVRPADDRVELVLFQAAPEHSAGSSEGIDICRRALDLVQRLHGWNALPLR